jgi:hypothetical protein
MLNAEGAKIVAEAIKVLSKYMPAIILAPFLSLSDLLFNCWCLLFSLGYRGVDEARRALERHRRRRDGRAEKSGREQVGARLKLLSFYRDLK